MTYSNPYASTSSPTNFIAFSGMGMRKGGRAMLMPSNYQGDGSTLNLDFTTMGGVLDPRLTFSRASTATFVNSSGYVEWAGANLCPYSQQINVGTWLVGASATLTPNTTDVLDPQGGNTATKIALGANAYNSRAMSLALPGGMTYTFSYWIRGTAGNQCRIYSNAGYVGDLVTETSYSYSTTAWTRVSTTFTTNVATTNVFLYVCAKQTFPATTDAIYVWGAQLNPGSTAQTYYPTTTAAYYAPRFDYSPTNIGEPRGLLIEGSSINKIYGSESLVSSGMPINWSYAGNVTRNSTLVTSPRGSDDAVVVNETVTSGLHRVSQSSFSGYTVGAVCTFSCWAKVAKSATPRKLFVNLAGLLNSQGLFDLTATGTSGTAQATGGTAVNKATSWIKYPGDWYRVTVTGNFVAESSQFLQMNRASSTTCADDSFIGETDNGIIIWGCQLEAGSGASSYISTGASQVTRTVDDCTITGTNFSSWYNPNEGSTLIQWTGGSGQNNVDGRSHTFLNSTQTHQIFEGSGYALNVYSTTFQAQIGNGIGSLNSTAKIASAFKAANFATSVNGSNAVVQSSGTMPTLVDRLSIGSNYLNAGTFKFVCIKQFKYYPVRLSDAQLKSLSTP